MGRFNYCLALIMIVSSCTSFKEEDVPDKLSVSVTELSYSQSGERHQVSISSGKRWNVTSSPEWIRPQSISSGHSPYEWTVIFSAPANDEYNREGKIMINAGSDTAEISVTQDGKKGKYVAVESVSLSPTELTLTEGENASLSYTFSPSNVSIKDVTWETSNSSIATVSQYGRVVANAEGTALITVTTKDGNKTATCTVMVKAKVIPVAGVSLDKTSISMTEGDTQTITATVIPSNATDKSVTWSSSNTSVATVSSSGVVTAKAAGSATITVTTTDGGKKATCSVTVNAQTVAVTGVSLNKTTMSLVIGGTEQLTATVSPSNATNKNVSWSSSNTSVATVDSNGNVSAIKVGTAIIKVTTEDCGKTATCSVTVNPIAVTGVTLNQTSLTMTVGDSQTLAATVTPSNATDKSVTWSSNNTSVATVKSAPTPNAIDLGLPSGLKWASFNLGASKPEGYGGYYAWGETETKTRYFLSSYKWYSGSNYTFTKYVTDTTYGTIDNNTILDAEDDAAHVELGGKWRLPTSAEWRELLAYCSWTWTSFNGVYGQLGTSKINGASIFLPSCLYPYGSFDGWVMVASSGYVTWTGGSRYAGFSVRPVYGNSIVPVTSVSLNKTSLSMKVGDTQSLTATVSPSNATEKAVIWSSSNTSVATVSDTGFITAKASGNAIITVTTFDGHKTATCSVTVSAATVAVTGVSLSKTSLSMTVGDTQRLTATVTPSNATDKSVRWSSSNTSVATISSSGVITAKSAGTATITVTTNDGAKKATCDIFVTALEYIVDGINYGSGIVIDGVIWAPVNCGFDSNHIYGLLFQWGRKYGQSYNDGKSFQSEANPTFQLGPVTLETGESASNKNVFYYYQDYNFWWATEVSLSLWNSGTEDSPKKTQNDPCPLGWRVPTRSELSSLLTNHSQVLYKEGVYGMFFSGSSTIQSENNSVFRRIWFFRTVCERIESASAWADSFWNQYRDMSRNCQH